MINKPPATYFEESPRGRCTERHIRISFPEFYEELNNMYNEYGIPFREKLYWYFHDIIQPPVCPGCGKPVKYMNFMDGYLTHCSTRCAYNDSSRMEKIRQTKLERYGDEGYNNKEQIIKTNNERYGGVGMGSPEVNEKIKHTNMDRYGVEYIGSSKELHEKALDTCQERYGGTGMGSSEIRRKIEDTKKKVYGDKSFTNRAKIEQTCIERYGFKSNLSSPETREKIKQTLLQKYGVEYIGQIPGVPDKTKQTTLERYGVISVFKLEENKMKAKQGRWKNIYKENPDVINVESGDDGVIYTCRCPHNPKECKINCNGTYTIPSSIRNNRRFQRIELCTKLLPINYGRIMNTSIELFIQSILDEYNIEYETNNRTILDGKELDIYIPAYRLAIECNGVYWHSLKEPKYHHEKWKSCMESGIQLLTLWEDQIVNKPEIIRNLILSKLGIYEHRTGARECELKDVPSSESRSFLDRYHLQGPVNGSVRLGLYYGGELVGLMVFGHKRTALGNRNHDTWELYRYCCKQGWQINGGASRLFNHFISEHPGSVVESFSSNDISSGELYRQLGFNNIGMQTYSYWYIDKHMVRYHRYTFRKDVLVRNGADPTLTEFRITDGMGLFRIYDSGQQKWKYNS